MLNQIYHLYLVYSMQIYANVEDDFLTQKQANKTERKNQDKMKLKILPGQASNPTAQRYYRQFAAWSTSHSTLLQQY